MSNFTSFSGDAASVTSLQSQPPKPAKKKRGLPGNPDPEAEVIVLSPRTLMATNRFVCEICNKGFQRDQNLQLHRRGHNLPWKLKQRANKEAPPRKKVYVCPEASCVHHDPARALGDLTGIKKHFSRKHGEKKWKCDKCSKKYAVQSDWKAHSKICGTREYRCDCGTLFSRRDSFITHRAFCDALAADESARSTAENPAAAAAAVVNPSLPAAMMPLGMKEEADVFSLQIMGRPSQALYPNSSRAGGSSSSSSSPYLSATALLQKAAQMGAIMSAPSSTTGAGLIVGANNSLHGFRATQQQQQQQQLPADAAAFLQHEQLGAAGRSFVVGAGLAAESEREEGSGGRVGLQLTRDFLGKRRGAGFSQDSSGIVDMATRLEPCNNKNMRSSFQDSPHPHAPWS